VISTLLKGLAAGFSWQLRVTMLQSLKRVLKHVYLSPLPSSDKPAVLSDEIFHRLFDSLLICLTDSKQSIIRLTGLECFLSLLERSEGRRVLNETRNQDLNDRIKNQLIRMHADRDPGVLRLQEKANLLLQAK